MTATPIPGQHFFWLGSRALGVTAMVLLSLTTGIGLALAGRPGARPCRLAAPPPRSARLAALAAIAGHGLLLLGDSYLKPGLAGIAVPFAVPGSRCGPASASSAAGSRRSPA